MRTVPTWIGSLALAVVTATAGGQLGTLPLLAPLPSGGRCQSTATDAKLRAGGVVRLVTYMSERPERTVSVGTDGQARPRVVMAFVSRPLTPQKHDGEHLSAMLTAAGRVTSGDRHYSTGGTPASLSEDRSGSLFPADTAQVERLARAVIARCGG